MKPIYFCTDIETSGQSYSTGSMVTIGIVPVLEVDGKWRTLSELQDTRSCPTTLYLRLERRPVPDQKETMDWWSTQSAELYHETFQETPRFSPAYATYAIAKYVNTVQEAFDMEAVFVSAPIGFDFDFVRNYFYCYRVKNPFGDPGRTLDPKSYMAGMLGITISECTMEIFARHFGKIEEKYHAHNALEDAKHVAARIIKMLSHMSFRQNHL